MQNKSLWLTLFIFISMGAMDNKEEKELYCPPDAIEIDPLKESIEKHAYDDGKRKGSHLAHYFTQLEKTELLCNEWQIKKDAPFKGSHAYNMLFRKDVHDMKGRDQLKKANDTDEKNDENKN